MPMLAACATRGLNTNGAGEMGGKTLVNAKLSMVTMKVVDLILCFNSKLVKPLFVSRGSIPALVPLIMECVRVVTPFFMFCTITRTLSKTYYNLNRALMPVVAALLAVYLFQMMYVLLILPSFGAVRYVM